MRPVLHCPSPETVIEDPRQPNLTGFRLAMEPGSPSLDAALLGRRWVFEIAYGALVGAAVAPILSVVG
jgi:hypothetical protein